MQNVVDSRLLESIFKFFRNSPTVGSWFVDFAEDKHLNNLIVTDGSAIVKTFIDGGCISAFNFRVLLFRRVSFDHGGAFVNLKAINEVAMLTKWVLENSKTFSLPYDDFQDYSVEILSEPFLMSKEDDLARYGFKARILIRT